MGQIIEKIKLLNKDKNAVFNKLYQMDNFDRVRLIDKYSKIAEPVYISYSDEKVTVIVTKLLKMKFSRLSLLNTFVNEDPVVDHPGYRLDEFLTKELTS